MKIPDEFKYDTLSELMERRAEIVARPFPQAYSIDESTMMMAVEEHCANYFMEALLEIKRLNEELCAYVDNDGYDLPQETDAELIAKLENVEEV